MKGAILWEGKARDGRPIVAVVTGLDGGSENPKTGPMAQAFLMRARVPPHVAVLNGGDKSVCNDCELRQYTVKRKAKRLSLRPGHKPPMCYVTVSNSVRSVYEAYRRGSYGMSTDIPSLVKGKRVRIGAYGNFSNAPLWVTEQLASGDGWTLYEHNWAAAHAQLLRPYAMASVSSVEDKERANRLGWRTFRVRHLDDPVLPDEVICPASDEAGHKATCHDCLLCRGTSLKAKNVVIVDHGQTSPSLRAKRFPLQVIK